MNHQEKLIESYRFVSKDLCNSQEFIKEIEDIIPQDILSNIELIGKNSHKKKAVYTVLVTLITHKCLSPTQDIRYHQSKMPNGFSGRSIDTKYITPTLKNLGLPSMAESGWLTRSLEQPAPYTMEYPGKIIPKKIKEAFLKILHFIEENTQSIDSKKVAELLLIYFLKVVRDVSIKDAINFNRIEETKHKKSEIKIDTIVSSLRNHFDSTTKGVSKLPVIAIYAIYEFLIKEMVRYDGCILKPLGSHTASDKTSRSAGDIEIFGSEQLDDLLEVIEIKHEKSIDKHIVKIAQEKIIKFLPERYFILSSLDIKTEDETDISEIIDETLSIYKCQIVINGILPTIKYYLRLIKSLPEFINHYSELIEKDREIDVEHKLRWIQILKNLSN